MVSGERGASSKTDGGVVKNIQLLESGLRRHPVDGVTIIKNGQDGHFDQCMFC